MMEKSHDAAMTELYREDPDLAVAMVNSILEDGDQAELIVTLRQIVQSVKIPAAHA